MQFSKVISFDFDSVKKRWIKILKSGKSDIQRVKEAGPMGIDSGALKDMIAIYSETSQQGHPVIIGYLNKNQLAKPGELRLFSTDPAGTLNYYLWFRNNGIEINGIGNFLTKFNELKAGFDLFVLEYNAHTHTGNLGAPTTPPLIPTTANIDGAKAMNIKTES